MSLKEFFRRNGIQQADAARVLGVVDSAVSMKVRGERPWFQHEIDALLAFLTDRLGRPVTYEEVFASSTPPASLPASLNPPAAAAPLDGTTGPTSDPAAGGLSLPSSPAAGEDLRDENLVARCRVCGCTEDRACEGGCWWVDDPLGGDLCSSCVESHDDHARPAAGMVPAAGVQPEGRAMSAYVTDAGKVVFIAEGLGGDTFGTFSSRPKSGSLQRFKSPLLPMRDTRAEAQADLDVVAAKRGWYRVD